MNKLLLSALGLICCINMYAVEFTAEITDEAAKECLITAISDHNVAGTLVIPSTINIGATPYTVTRIKAFALNDMPNVTKVCIPKTVTCIGYCYNGNLAGDPDNFLNCPKLEAFEVESGGKDFTSVDGLLLAYHVLARVPQSVATANGTLKLPVKVSTLGPQAFNDVTTVTKLDVGPVTSYRDNCGLNTMPWLSEITVYDTKSTLKSYKGVLYDSTNGTLISFPARRADGFLSIPSYITKIGRYAFANAYYLYGISYSSITEIGYGAFMGSNIKLFDIYPVVKKIDKYAFANCPVLKTLRFLGSITELPAYMAKSSPALETVTYNSTPEKIGTGAFADCTSLTKHPFSNFQLGDSVFANTGFETVVFDNSAVRESYVEMPIVAPRSTFSGCRNLTSIDISNLVTDYDHPYRAGNFFAAFCPKLTEVAFPAYTYFGVRSHDAAGNIGIICSDGILNKIIMGNSHTSGTDPVFSLIPSRPNIYIKNDGLKGSTNILNYIGTPFSKPLNPIIYLESPNLPPYRQIKNAGASYYVPGGTIEKLQDAIDAGVYVEEFYRLKFETVNNGLVIKIKEVFPDMVKLKRIETDNVSWTTSNYGDYDTAIPPQYVKWVKITYTVHGVEFTSTYDPTFLASADITDTVMDPAADTTPVYYDLYGNKVTDPRPGNIYIVRQNGTTTKQLF